MLRFCSRQVLVARRASAGPTAARAFAAPPPSLQQQQLTRPAAPRLFSTSLYRYRSPAQRLAEGTHKREMGTAAVEMPRQLDLSPFLKDVNAPPAFAVGSQPLETLLEGWHRVQGENGKPSYAVFVKEIEKSPNDDRDYRLILLENGMECLLISDPKTDKASASMSVKAGHLNDPDDLPGLAHFCEHLMFMGTEKYPRENDYTEYLTQNSGSSNAFTGMDDTCYYFDVHPSALNGALDRFAQFFIAPRFDPSCSEREANAVHSENAKNLQSDMWRMFQLDKSTSSRSHPYWKFGTGNRVTLWDEPSARGEDVRARLIEWQERHYSSNLMKLAVLGKDSLDDMTKAVVDMFSPSQNRALNPPTFPGSPLTEEELGKTIFLKSVKDVRGLDLSFPFPDEEPFYETKPGAFLSHLIGHEGDGSILSYLKRKGWANSLSSGCGSGATGFAFFKVHVDLTQAGLDHYEEVAGAVFKYIELLKQCPPEEWAFLEVRRLNDIAFRFKEKSPPTMVSMSLSLEMSKPLPRENLLSAPYITKTFNKSLIETCINGLSPERCRVMVATQKGLPGITYDQKEKWYGTEYSIQPMSAKMMNRQEASIPELFLPKPNEFIPTDLAVHDKKPVEHPAKRPISLRNTPTMRLWYKKDDRWWVPRASVFFLLKSPLVDDSAKNAVHARFFTELIQDALMEYSYDAELAGLSYQYDVQGDGILLTVEGYNDKLNVLSKVILEKMANLQVDPPRFERVKDQLQRLWTNYRLEQPYQHALFSMSVLTIEVMYTPEQKLETLPDVSPESLQAYIKALTERAHFELMVHGNILKNEAMGYADLVEQTFKPKALTSDEMRSHRALVVPEGQRVWHETVSSPDNVNSAVEQLTYIGDIMNDDLRVKTSLLNAMLMDPIFDQLRTKEQLGYIVSSGSRKSIGFMGLRVIVQSERSPMHVESRINAFWDSFRATLDGMSAEDFEKYKITVRNNKTEDHKNLWQESSHLWVHVHSGYYDFLQKERDAASVMELTKGQMLAYYDEYILGKGPSPLRRLSVHLRSQRIQPDVAASLAPAVMQTLKTPPTPEVQQQMAAFIGSKPTVAAAKAFATQFLAANAVEQAAIDRINAHIEELGKPEPLLEGLQAIEDKDAFRDSCERGPYAEPVREFSDVVQAKM